MCEYPIICGLQFFRDKAGERVEQRRLSHRYNCEIGRDRGRIDGKNTCLARSNSEK